MAQRRQRNIVERLADVGEEAIQRFGGAPGADRLVGALGSVRDRVDDLQRRVRGLEGLEKRLAAIERRLDKIEGKTTTRQTTTRKTATRRTTSRKKTT
jgi:hypothetical protein